MENSMRKMILMAIAGLLWKKFGGKTAQRFSILRITTQDHGMLVLECR